MFYTRDYSYQLKAHHLKNVAIILDAGCTLESSKELNMNSHSLGLRLGLELTSFKSSSLKLFKESKVQPVLRILELLGRCRKTEPRYLENVEPRLDLN